MSDLMNQPDFGSESKRPAVNPIECSEVRDLIPAVALGAIETGSAIVVRSHCEQCPACAADLAGAERVATFLPFTAPSIAPPSDAKSRLMERIAAPAVPQFATFDDVIIDSPAAKRSMSRDISNEPSADILGWTRGIMSGSSIRLAAAPLALALVFVSLYGFGVFDRDAGNSNVIPTVESAAANVGDSIESAAVQEITFLSATTGGATVGQQSPAIQESLTSSFMARSSRQATQTELMKSVVPSFAECEIERADGNSWLIEVSGVSLRNVQGPVDVYLIDNSGVMHEVGDVTLDEFGNGVVSVTLDQPLSNFSTLQIGPDSDTGLVGADGRFMTFQFDLGERHALALGKSG